MRHRNNAGDIFSWPVAGRVVFIGSFTYQLV